MGLRGFLLGAAILAAGLLPAAADSVTSTVSSWNPATRTLVLGDKTQYLGIPATVAVPENLVPGTPIRITLDSLDNGAGSILAIEVQP